MACVCVCVCDTHSLFLSVAVLHFLLSSTAIMKPTALLILLTTGLPFSHSFASLFFSFTFILSTSVNARVNQYSQSLIPFVGKLWSFLSTFVFPPSYDLN